MLLTIEKEGNYKKHMPEIVDYYEKADICIYLIGKCYDKSYDRLLAKDLYAMIADTSMFDLSAVQGSFSIIYIVAGKVFFGTDYLGMGRVFYYYDDKVCIISDNIGQIVKEISKELTIDYVAWSDFLYFSYILGNRTFFCEIKTVYPGFIMNLQTDSWHLESLQTMMISEIKEDHNLDFDSAVESAVSLLKKNIKNIISNNQGNKIICPLSGGYDSRCIAGVLKSQEAENVYTYSAYLDNGNGLDEHYGNLVAEFLQYFNEKIELDQDYFEREIECYLQDCNFESSMHIPFWNIYKKIDFQNAILLDGYGGDRLLRTVRAGDISCHDKEDFYTRFFERNGNQNIKTCMGVKEKSYLLYLAKEDMVKELKRCDNNITVFYLNNRNARNIAYNTWHLDKEVDVFTPFTNFEFLQFALSIPQTVKTQPTFYKAVLNSLNHGLGEIPSTNDEKVPAIEKKIYANSICYREKMVEELGDTWEATGGCYEAERIRDLIKEIGDTGKRLDKLAFPFWFYKYWKTTYKNTLKENSLEQYFHNTVTELERKKCDITIWIENIERKHLTELWLGFIKNDSHKKNKRMKLLYTMDVEGFLWGGVFSHGIEFPDKKLAVNQLVYGGTSEGKTALEKIATNKDFVFTFFVEPYSPIWESKKELGELLHLCDGLGNEVGMHCHGFSLSEKFLSEKHLKWNAYQQSEGFLEILNYGVDIYNTLLKKQPISYRAGAFRIYPEHFKALKKAGFLIDSSLWHKNPFNYDLQGKTIKNECKVIDDIYEIPCTTYYNTQRNRVDRFDLNTTSYAQKLELISRNLLHGTEVLTMLSHSWSFSDYYLIQGKYGEIQKKCHYGFSENSYDELMYLTEFIQRTESIDFVTCKQLYEEHIVDLVDVCGEPIPLEIHKLEPKYGKLRDLDETGFLQLSDGIVTSSNQNQSAAMMRQQGMELILPEKKQPKKGDFTQISYKVDVKQNLSYQVHILLDCPYYKEKFRGRNTIRYTVEVNEKRVFKNFITEPVRDEVVYLNVLAERDELNITICLECLEDEQPWGWGSAARTFIRGIHVN